MHKNVAVQFFFHTGGSLFTDRSATERLGRRSYEGEFVNYSMTIIISSIIIISNGQLHTVMPLLFSECEVINE